MRVKVLYFAKLKQITDKKQEDVSLPENSDMSTLYEHLNGKYANFLNQDHLACAVNGSYVSLTQKLEEGDTVSFIPPVAGG